MASKRAQIELNLDQLSPNFSQRWANLPKTLFEITCQKVFQDRCSPESTKPHGSLAGCGGAAPLEIRPPSLEEVVLGRRGACWCVLGRFRNVLKEPLPYIPSPRALPPAVGPYFFRLLGPISTRKNRGNALWDLQKSRFGRGWSSKNAAKPKDFTFSPTKTS